MIPFKIKPGVRTLGFEIQVVLVLLAAMPIWAGLGALELVLTGGVEGEHMRGSVHYRGGAWDLRVRDEQQGWRIDPDMAASRLAAALGDDFDVVAHETHVHVEWQPKVGFG